MIVLLSKALLDTGVSRSNVFLARLLSLPDDECVAPGWSVEVQQVLVATWSAHGSADPLLNAFGSAWSCEWSDLVEVQDEDHQFLGLRIAGKL